MRSRLLLSRLCSARSVAVIPPSNSITASEPVCATFLGEHHHKHTYDTTCSRTAGYPCSISFGSVFRGVSSTSASWAASNTSANGPTGSIVSFPLAQTGEGISECELMQWFVQEGDVVEEFQPICEVQSDKAAIEITSRHSGTIVKVHHLQGDLVKVGAPLIDIQLTAAAAAAAGPTDATVTAEPTTTTTTTTSSSNSSSDSDSAVESADSPISVKAAPTVRRLARELKVDLTKVQGSGPDGRITKDDVERFKAGLVSRIADKLVDRIAQTAGPTTTAEMYAAAAEPRFEGDAQAAAAAAAAREAAGGSAGAQELQDAAGVTTTAAAAAAAGVREGEAVTRIPIRGYWRAMIKSATEAAAIPTFHYMDEVYVDGLLHLRRLLKDDPTLAGAKLTYLPFIVKALSISLSVFPGLNCSLEPGGQALLQRHSHNIGVAMATGNGLVVPNIKQVEQRSIPDIAQELARLQHLAAAGKLSTDDVSHGSLTISNIGTVGGTNATPMLNPPEAAIVALGRVQALPRYDVTGNDIVKRHVMSISWGGDHRVIDGAAVAEFSNYWKHLLEEPSRLLMHIR